MIPRRLSRVKQPRQERAGAPAPSFFFLTTATPCRTIRRCQLNPVARALGECAMNPRAVALSSLLFFVLAAASSPQDGVKHSSGRPLPALPPIKEPVMFNTPEADRILTAMQVFPVDNPWNEDISRRPVHPNSKNIIASAGANKPLLYNLDMSFIIIPPDQKKVPVKVVGYPDESDLGPYPLPNNTPIEDWPLNGKKLEVIQREGK